MAPRGGADVMRANSGWITLREASGKLTGQFGLSGWDMIERALHSGEVPFRAVTNLLDTLATRIEKQINPGMRIDIGHISVIRDQFGYVRWWNVEVRWAECIAYCEVNLLPSSAVESRDPRGRKPEKLEGAKQAMELAIDQKRISWRELAAMKGKELAHEFKVGRTTAVAARRAVLEGVDSAQIKFSTNNDK
jgi:hypothetical protein